MDDSSGSGRLTAGSQRLVGGFAAWSSTSAFVMVAQLGYAAVTARQLPVEAFGAYAVALTGIGLVSLVGGSSMGLAAGRREHESDDLDRSLLTLSIVVGALAAAAVFLLAPLWTAVWAVDGATATTRALGLGLPFISVNAVLSGILRRKGRTSFVAVRLAVGQIIGLVLGLWAVVKLGQGWTLASAPVLGAMAGAPLLAVGLPLHNLKPRRPSSEIRADMAYSAKAAGINAVRYTTNLLAPWSIGRFAGSDALGAYNRATTVITVPLYTLQNALTYTLFPELRPGGPAARNPRAFTDLMVVITWVIVLVGGLGILAAGPFLSVLLGPQWAQAVALGGLALLLGVVPLLELPLTAAAEALGHFRVSTLAWALGLPAILLGAWFTYRWADPVPAMWGLVGAKVIALFVVLAFLARIGLLQLSRYLRDVRGVLAFQAIVSGGLAISLIAVGPEDGQRLLIIGLVGAAELLIVWFSRYRTALGRIGSENGMPGFSRARSGVVDESFDGRR